MSAAVPNPVTGDYRSFDRSTKAGRMLHNIYNQPKKESTLDRVLLEKLQQRRKMLEALERPKEKPVPKSRAYVELPSPPRREYPKHLPPIGRRPLQLIEQNEREAAAEARMREEAAKTEKKPVRTDEDKFRLQHKFQFGVEPSAALARAFHAKLTGEKLPVEELSASRAAAAAASAADAERRLWQKRFSELSDDISDLKQSLAEIDSSARDHAVAVPAASGAGHGLGSKTAAVAHRERRHRIVTDLQDKLKELKAVDQKLRELDFDTRSEA